MTKKFAKLSIVFYLALGLIFYNEFLVYWISYLNWPSLHFSNQSKNTSDRPIRLLLVADPQLIGENDEPWFLSWIARKDSDRYLRNTYILANSYVQPDATLYLGDLFDEGLKSSDEQVQRYFDRFQHIFQCEKMEKNNKIKQVFISGDNDIGGEYIGDRNDYLAERFERYFGEIIDVVELNSFINLVKLDLDYTISFYNKLKQNYVRKLLNQLKSKQDQNSKRYTIVMNHMSLINKRDFELNEINRDTNTSLIIKGDSHEFYIVKFNYETNRVEEYTTYKKNPSNLYTLHLMPSNKEKRIQSVYELSIPTCSYRMGVPNMGYGMLTITPKGRAYVSILWLPSRYTCLKYYYYFLLFFIMFILINFFKKIILKSLEYLYRRFFYRFFYSIRFKKQSQIHEN